MPSLCSMPDAEDVVPRAKPAVGVGQEFRDEEERDARRSGRRIGKPRQHEMHDVLGEIVLAVGDEDFLAEDAVGSVGAPFGAGRQRAEIGAGLRLRQVHRAGPFAGDDAAADRAPSAHRCAWRSSASTAPMVEHRAEREGHAGAVPHLLRRGGKRDRQPLPADVLRRGDAVPAARDQGAIDFAPAGRGGRPRRRRAARLPGRRRGSAAPAPRWRSGRPRRARRRQDPRVRLRKGACGQRLAEPGDVLQRKGDLGDRRAIHRCDPPRFLIYSQCALTVMPLAALSSCRT